VPYKPIGQPNESDRTRRGSCADPQADVLLRFARTMVEKRGVIEGADITAVQEAGYGDAEIAEVVAHVGLRVVKIID
jgi:hypothetical protein